MARINYGRGDATRILYGLMRQENPVSARRVFEELDLPVPSPETARIPLPFRSILGVIEKAASITGNPMIGLGAGQMFRYDQFGAIGTYVSQAQDLDSAFRRYAQTLNFMQTGSRLNITEVGDQIRVGLDHPDFPAIGGRHSRDYILGVLITTARLVLGPDWKPDRIENGTPRGRWDQSLEDAFQTEVHRSENDVAILFSRDLLNTGSSVQIFEHHLTIHDVARDQAALPIVFPDEVISAVDRRLRLHRTGLDDIARELALSTRSLQRRLDEHGLKFRELVLQRRMRWARELIFGTDLDLAQISRQIGYGDAPQFARAYKNVFGETAGMTRVRQFAAE